MQLTLVSALLIGMTLVPAQTFLTKALRRVRATALLDRELADSGEVICARIASTLQLNSQLEALYIGCEAAATNPATMSAIEAAAQAIVARQELELLRVRAALLLWHTRANTAYEPARRPLPGPCALPGLLRWPTQPVRVTMKRRSGGIAVTSLPQPAWDFEDPAVRPL